MDTPEIPKTYNAKEWEDKLYSDWEKSGFFAGEATSAVERYVNILPPPNANGELHLGHASGYTVMDIFGRFERMCGKNVLLLPGKDHAGIQTQVVFEKKLRDERGLTRHDLGREKFYEETYAFCTDRSRYMRSQEKRIGLSADWNREKFTLDPEVSRRALETFVQMYQDGLIYRGERIIHWCSRCATALSDIEVIHTETDGSLFFIEYPVKDSDERITVATTRPETMLGDTGVAVHPDDTRYHHLIGKTLVLPLVGREIPIIADKRIDQTFGTGAVKVTPAHDPLDWEIGETHTLPKIQVIGFDAHITNDGGVYAGLSLHEARQKILADLAASRFLQKEEAHTINLSRCERCKTTVEPLISKQWFVNVDAPHYSLKQKSIEALRANAILFSPEASKDQMIQWLENLHDWCISRQLWWGHRIPVWYRGEEVFCGMEAPNGDGWEQEQDTLDTWFSSGQWPYTTLDYPDSDDAKAFYPTDMMVMGRDLLFFWATRMVMFGLYRTSTVPFKRLYFTGLVRDKEGQKMSKSKGNGIDVLEMIDAFGSDAVRLSLVLGTTPGLDFRLYEEKIETYRNFTNKLWNIGRYVGQATRDIQSFATPEIKTDADKWLIATLKTVTASVTQHLERCELSLAGEELREFTWNDFADWYVEVHKVEKNDALLCFAFDTLLKLWHPFMPFVTEAIHQTFRFDKSEYLMIAKWPMFPETSQNISDANRFELVKGLIGEIRNVRASYHIEPATTMKVSAYGDSEQLLRDNEATFKRLARVSELRALETVTAPNNTLRIQYKFISAFLHLEDVVDVAKERTRFTKEKTEKEKYIATLEAKLSNENFVSRAKPEIVEAERVKLTTAQKELADINAHLSSLQ